MENADIENVHLNIQSYSLHKLRKINSAHATDINITIPLSISSYMQGLSRNSRSLSLPSKQLSWPSFAFPRESYSCSRFPAPLIPLPLPYRSLCSQHVYFFFPSHSRIINIFSLLLFLIPSKN